MNPHKPYSTSPLALMKTFGAHHFLIWQLTRREILGRYRGSLLGVFWAIVNPVVMLLVYTFVFSVAFKARWGLAAEESKADFAAVLFIGMIIHGIVAECAMRAPTLVLNHASYVKKVVFPLEILPVVALSSIIFHSMVSVLILIAGIVLLRGDLSLTALWLPVVMLPLIVGALGLVWFLASIGVFLRDTAQVMGIFSTMLLFVSPVFYPISAVPEIYRPLLRANPLTFVIEQSRQVLFWSRAPDFEGLAEYSAAALLACWCGFWWFQKTRRGFSDVL